MLDVANTCPDTDELRQHLHERGVSEADVELFLRLRDLAWEPEHYNKQTTMRRAMFTSLVYSVETKFYQKYRARVVECLRSLISA